MATPTNQSETGADAADASKLSNARIEWAQQTLGIGKVVADLNADISNDPKQLKAAGLSTFFQDLETSGFYTSSQRIEAAQILAGVQPESQTGFRANVETEQLAAIDRIVHAASKQLGCTPHGELVQHLQQKVARYQQSGSSSKVRTYARSVPRAAAAFDLPAEELPSLVIKLLQAVFRITAIRSDKRREVRNRLVRTLKKQHTRADLKHAVEILNGVQLPHAVFFQPFLDRLTWTGQQTDSFTATPPARTSFLDAPNSSQRQESATV